MSEKLKEIRKTLLMLSEEMQLDPETFEDQRKNFIYGHISTMICDIAQELKIKPDKKKEYLAVKQEGHQNFEIYFHQSTKHWKLDCECKWSASISKDFGFSEVEARNALKKMHFEHLKVLEMEVGK